MSVRIPGVMCTNITPIADDIVHDFHITSTIKNEQQAEENLSAMPRTKRKGQKRFKRTKRSKEEWVI